MVLKNKIIYLKSLYIFFVFLSLIIFFFSTAKGEGKAFEIDNIKITMPFEMNFNKNKVIDEGFKKAFSQLMTLIVNSSEIKKVDRIKLNEIKGMIESFSIKEEKFINEVYYVNLGVSFNKKKIFNYLQNQKKGKGGEINFQPLLVNHGDINALGFKIGKLAYIPDVLNIPSKAWKELENLDILIIDALRRDPHPSHTHLEKTLQWLKKLDPKRAILTNLHNDLDYSELKKELPKNIEPAFDGLEVKLK